MTPARHRKETFQIELMSQLDGAHENIVFAPLILVGKQKYAYFIGTRAEFNSLTLCLHLTAPAHR